LWSLTTLRVWKPLRVNLRRERIERSNEERRLREAAVSKGSFVPDGNFDELANAELVNMANDLPMNKSHVHAMVPPSISCYDSERNLKQPQGSSPSPSSAPVESYALRRFRLDDKSDAAESLAEFQQYDLNDPVMRPPFEDIVRHTHARLTPDHSNNSTHVPASRVEPKTQHASQRSLNDSEPVAETPRDEQKTENGRKRNANAVAPSNVARAKRPRLHYIWTQFMLFLMKILV